MSGKKKLYVIYDARAAYDVDNAAVMSVADSLKEARRDRAMFPGSVIYEYDEVDGAAVGGKVVR